MFFLTLSRRWSQTGDYSVSASLSCGRKANWTKGMSEKTLPKLKWILRKCSECSHLPMLCEQTLITDLYVVINA